jgi:hypothetical protein
MFRLITIPSIIISVLLFSHINFAQINEANPEKYFEGKSGIDLNLGIYNNSTVASTTIVTAINASEITNATGGFSGSISYQYWFKNYLSFRIGVGALVSSVDTKTYSGVLPSFDFTGNVTTEVATVTSILTGLNFYPLQITDEKRVLPYVSLYVGPYIGIYNQNEVLNTVITEKTTVETVFGSRVGAGFDVLIGSIFKLGVNFGYNFLGDFTEPIGSELNYSGPDYSMTFGFVF